MEREAILDIMRDELNFPLLDDGCSLDELDVDSIDVTEILIAVEDSMGIEIDEVEPDRPLVTVGDLVDHLLAHVRES